MNSGIMLRYAAIAGLLVMVSACTRTLSVSTANPERPALEGGRPMLQSQGKYRVDVVLLNRKFSYKLKTLPAFYVKVWNGGDTPIEFSTKNITAYSGKSRVEVYTSSQLKAWAGRNSELADVQDAFTSWDVYSGPLSGGNWRGEKTATDANVRPGRIHAANKPRRERHLILLRSQEVRPGETVGGGVKLNAEAIKTGQPLYLIVTVAGEVHRFVFAVGNG